LFYHIQTIQKHNQKLPYEKDATVNDEKSKWKDINKVESNRLKSFHNFRLQ